VFVSGVCRPSIDPGYTEVDHINEVAQRDQDVRRLDVAVDEVVSVRGIQGLGDLADKVHSPLRRDPTVRFEHPEDIGAVHQAHVNEELAIDLAEVMNGNDVRIPQSRGDVRFTLESLDELLVTRQGCGQELECDIPVTVRVVRLINFAHSADTQQRFKAIVSDLPYGHENRPPQKVTIASLCTAYARAYLNHRPVQAQV
jgi:hypothetical protein